MELNLSLDKKFWFVDKFLAGHIHIIILLYNNDSKPTLTLTYLNPNVTQ